MLFSSVSCLSRVFVILCIFLVTSVAPNIGVDVLCGVVRDIFPFLYMHGRRSSCVGRLADLWMRFVDVGGRPARSGIPASCGGSVSKNYVTIPLFTLFFCDADTLTFTRSRS